MKFMKKIIITVASIFIGISGIVASTIDANPIISRGKPVYTSNGPANYLVDNKFKSEAWSVADNSWIAILLETGPTKVFGKLEYPDYAWSNELSPAKCPNKMSFPVDYDILTSSNSTMGRMVIGIWLVQLVVILLLRGDT